VPFYLFRSTGVSSDWRMNVAIEERTAVRGKLKDAYKNCCPSYEDLLKLCVAVDEELIFSGCKTRMEYFKNAVQWNNRLQIKNKQLKGNLKLGSSAGNGTGASQLMKLKRVVNNSNNSMGGIDNGPAAKKSRIST
jgi:hypothetical protein